MAVVVVFHSIFESVVRGRIFNGYKVEKLRLIRFGSHFEPWWKLAATRVITSP